jgi:hypothetical protein
MAPPARVPNWERLQRELRADVDQALKVAVLLQHGIAQQQIADRLGIPLADVKASLKRLRRIAWALEREELPEEFEGATTLVIADLGSNRGEATLLPLLASAPQHGRWPERRNP